MKKLLVILLKLIAVLFVVGALGVFAIIIKYRLELPNIQSMVEDYKPQMATTIYDKNNNVVDVLEVDSRDAVKLEDVSPYVKEAFLAIEDKKFYSHHGLHFKGIIRAVLTNFLKGKATQGGSSITQQLAKNAFLTPERTFSRKVKEAILKEHILSAPTLETLPGDAVLYLDQIIKDGLQNVTLEVTEQCNLRCKYCSYQDDHTEYREFSGRKMAMGNR